MTRQELESTCLYLSLNEDFSLDGKVFDSLDKTIFWAGNYCKSLDGQASLNALKKMLLRVHKIELTKASPQVLAIALAINECQGRINQLLSPKVVEWIENKLQTLQKDPYRLSPMEANNG